MRLPTRTITLEEHVLFPSLDTPTTFYDNIWKILPQVKDLITDHATARLADMDHGHVSLQLMSHLPGMPTAHPEGCHGANDEMAAAIAKNPDRLAGFAALPMAEPSKAAQELERAVKDLGLAGAMIDNHLADGTHYDDTRFWPVFEMAERLDVPIYIHPAPPSEEMVQQRFGGNYEPVTKMGMATGAWGWHENVGLHVLKLYAAGLFERYPKLKIIIGHMGEMLPIWIDRVDGLKFFEKAGLPGFRKVWEKNIWVTSSGIFSVRTLEMLMKVTSMDRILYSIDAPFNSSELGWKFIEDIAASGVLTDEEMDMFVHENAKKLLKL